MEQKGKLSIKSIVAIGIGAALFFVLGRFVAIPSFIPNTTISIQYGILSVFCVLFGPVVGLLVGLIGHILIDLTWGIPWWSWIIGSAVYGLSVGLFTKKIDIESGKFGGKEIAIFNIVQVIASILTWCVISPGLDVLVYSEPANKVFTQGGFATISNAIGTAIVGTILLIAYSKTRISKGSLKKED